ncbi:MAG: B12-binding domain-containing radical SAM protein [Syntrophorhabdaceae bacterium]|nr:B12-binding domain-containing radical SAM protein [Syntrophorhabdaceae bacterium]
MGGRRIPNIHALEKGVQIKNWRNRTPVCVVFPNTYYVGMSNLAVHLLYRLLNNIPDIVCERAFFEEDKAILSVESKRPLSSFECLFFTLSFELDYINIIKILRQSRINIHAQDRNDGEPIVVGGGISVMANPEPLYRFFDLFLMGDIEAVMPDFIDYYLDKRGSSRSEIIEGTDKFKWAYNPGRLHVEYMGDGHIKSFRPEGFKVYIERYRAEPLARSAIVTQNTEFSDMFLIEGTRGCPSRCPFCLLGNIYDFIYDKIAHVPEDIKDIGLIGGGICFHPKLEEIVGGYIKMGKTVHFPSLRIDKIPTSIIEMIGDTIKTLTFGIEAGSEYMRSYLGKPIKDSHILETITSIMKIKPFNLKLYFIIGLPKEKRQDIESIVELVKRIKHIMIKEGAKKGAVGSITVHVSPFCPKPATPFQRMPMEDMAQLKEKINYLKRAFNRIDNTYFTHESVKYSFVQAVFARGDRRVADIIERLSEGENLNKIMRENPVNLNFYALRERQEHEVLPWSFIER